MPLDCILITHEAQLVSQWGCRVPSSRVGLPRFDGRLVAFVPGTAVNDGRWKGVLLEDRCWGSAGRVVLDPRPADRQGLEVGLFAMLRGAHRVSCGRAAFELVGARVPQRGVQAPGVVPRFQVLEDGLACLRAGLERTPVDEFAFERGEEPLGSHCRSSHRPSRSTSPPQPPGTVCRTRARCTEPPFRNDG